MFFTSSTKIRIKNNTFGNYQPLSSLVILMYFIHLYEKTSRSRLCCWIYSFVLTDPITFWTTFVMYTSDWKKSVQWNETEISYWLLFSTYL